MGSPTDLEKRNRVRELLTNPAARLTYKQVAKQAGVSQGLVWIVKRSLAGQPVRRGAEHRSTDPATRAAALGRELAAVLPMLPEALRGLLPCEAVAKFLAAIEPPPAPAEPPPPRINPADHLDWARAIGRGVASEFRFAFWGAEVADLESTAVSRRHG
ncbi:MAG TPA: hypothetical protein VN641_06485 [Urbifossiella sp.]|nr:hypothetical protein [Urbifossiella sp.]